MTTERKLFTAELQRLRAHGAAQPQMAGASSPDVMKALDEIKGEIRTLQHLVKGEEPPPVAAQVASLDEVLGQKQAEVQMLKTELRALAVCIEQTKQEIAALRPKDSDDDRIIAVTYELDAFGRGD
ncbi:MAG: hypothetical protein AB1918_16255, partial [Pseudomonadota bacterium]